MVKKIYKTYIGTKVEQNNKDKIEIKIFDIFETF